MWYVLVSDNSQLEGKVYFYGANDLNDGTTINPDCNRYIARQWLLFKHAQIVQGLLMRSCPFLSTLSVLDPGKFLEILPSFWA